MIAANYSLPLNWPGDRIIEQLTERGAGLFIWADTVVKFVEQGIPNMRLNSIFNGRFQDAEGTLDGLYRQVLNLSFQMATAEEIEIYKQVVGAIVLAKIPLRRHDLGYFLDRDQEEESITSILVKLSSVISAGAGNEPIHISHLSFAEFVCNRGRCDERFAIHRSVHERAMALACFRVMRAGLRFNICQLETSHVRNVDVPDLASRIKEFIPMHLFYSCRFWSDHLQPASIDVETVGAVNDFLQTRLLYWLEVLSLIKELNIASEALMSLRKLMGVGGIIQFYN
jgi:hypothetical protein